MARGPNEPQLPRMEEAARGIGTTIGNMLPPNVGFCLMLFTFGPDGWSTYMSNAQRSDMVAAVRELLDKLEAM